MELSEHIMQVIIRQLNGEASVEEREKLMSWIDESPENKQEYEAYLQIWRDSLDVLTQHNFDTADAWKKVQKRVGPPASDTPSMSARIFSLKRFLVAASVIVAVSIVTFYFLKSDGKTNWETVVAANENRQISLPDGSTVLLRKGSTFRYSTKFEAGDRSTELSGEGFFEVQPDRANPFKITTSQSVVEVLGTSFLVRSSAAKDEVVVNEGRVRFTERGDLEKKVVLTKRQQASLEGNTFFLDTVLSNNYLAWESGSLVFNNTPLKQVIRDVSNLYGVEIVLSPDGREQLADIKIQAEFNNQTLEQVLDEIRLMTGLNITREKNRVIIHK